MAEGRKAVRTLGWLAVGGALALFGPSMIAVGSHSYPGHDSYTSPANDDFANAREIGGHTGSTNGSTAGASKQENEPHHDGNRGGASVWFAWVAPDSGTADFDTAGSDFDTLLAVYRSIGFLVPVASNDDTGPGFTSAVSFAATGGTTYYIAIDGFFGDGPDFGPYVLNWLLTETNPPETTILSGPSGTVESEVATFSFQANEPGSIFECQLDSGAFEPCTSPKTYSGLPSGQHTFSVRAKDPADNVDPTPAQQTWTIVFIDPRCDDPGVICGSSAGETITGTNGDDTILGGGGNDICLGLGGNDHINCGPGNDLIEGGDGNDILESTTGNDVIRGGAGKDRISGGSGRDRLSGNGGADRLSGGSGRDRLSGNSGNDRLDGGPGRDRCDGGKGRNRLRRC